MPSVTAQIIQLRPTHGDTSPANARRHNRKHMMPSLQDIMDIPAAVAGVYELEEKEIKTTRSRIYSLNRENAFGWRWRTLMEKGSGRYHTLLVWRIH